MVLMTLADGRVVEPELMRMRWIHSKLAGQPATDEEVRAIVAKVSADKLEIDSYLTGIRDALTLDGKRRVLKAAFAIATADGRVLDEEDSMMLRIAKALEISPREYRVALSQMLVARDFE